MIELLNSGTDGTRSCNSDYHTITATTSSVYKIEMSQRI